MGFAGHLAVDTIEKHFCVAENRIKRRAQLVTHVGQELRLMLTGDLELPALVLDLAEQPCILDGEHRLVGESLHDIYGPPRELSLLAPQENKCSEDALRPHERNNQDASDSSSKGRIPERPTWQSAEIIDRNRSMLPDRRSHHRFCFKNLQAPNLGRQSLFKAGCPPQNEPAVGSIVAEQRTGFGLPQRHGRGRDQIEDAGQVESAADCLAGFCQGL